MISIESKWSSLGVAFAQEATENQNPEELIIETIMEVENTPGESRVFSCMMLWLNRYHPYVRAERVKCLARKIDNDLHKAILGGIARKMVNAGNHRWESISRDIKKKLNSFEYRDSELALKVRGLDEDFAEFGLFVRKTPEESERKLVKKEFAFRNNKWLYNRLKYGVNLRADVVTCIELDLAQNAYQASKVLNCSMNAAYRNWGEIEFLNRVDTDTHKQAFLIRQKITNQEFSDF